MSTLAQDYDSLSHRGAFNNIDVPDTITGNLAKRIDLRPYQIEALKRWLYYCNSDPEANSSNPHLLFHMATGSGKTILMAALILDLYQRGYRNFLFFVNSNQIIEKTKDNFLNEISPKYLFNHNIKMEGKPVKVIAVDNFESVNSQTINIHFTTIQGLHTRILNPKEDAVTIEDFTEFKTVMISDEAHHLNTLTKNKLSDGEDKQQKSWENTVTSIFEQHPNNILLEFTATADLKHSAIKKKYNDKVLYDYQLISFRRDGYSKDVELRQADLEPLERMMQAIVLSQYRLKVAEKHGIFCKPVILMKSKTISESAKNESLFKSMISDLTGQNLKDVWESSSQEDSVSRAFQYINKIAHVEMDEFALELKGDFGDGKIVNVNKLKDLEELQIDLNNLENRNNDIRVIFAVNKLNEGWDVLNLFDIVRLYNTRDSRGTNPGRTTISEAQLIGRGARYFPFTDANLSESSPEKRKYDNNLQHPLRILEELHYHCSHNPRYIDEIKRALIKTGMVDEINESVSLRLKESFKESKFYKIGYVLVNKKEAKYSRYNADSLSSYEIAEYFIFPRPLATGIVHEMSAFDSRQNQDQPSNEEVNAEDFSIASFSKPILDFAMDSNEFFHFVNLKNYFPKLKSVSEFQTMDSYLGKVQIQVRGIPEDLNNLTSHQKIKIAQYVLNQIEVNLKRRSREFVGSTKATKVKISDCFTDKTIKMSITAGEKEHGLSWKESKVKDLNLINPTDQDWYAYDNIYGTEEEKRFIEFLYHKSNKLKQNYEEFFLLRNEKAIKLYSFQEGKGFEPDFILFLRKKGSEVGEVLQLFIEPKGKHLIAHDSWKQDFLTEIQWRDEIQEIFQEDKYIVYGLPFFNHENQQEFKIAFQRFLEAN